MNIAIIGGRDFDNYELLKLTLLSAPELDFNTNGTVYSVVSGGAKGTDSLAERFAEE